MRSLDPASHADCFACGARPDGLGLEFRPAGADSVTAEWWCDERFQSYPGIVHGGVVATLLDAAMTNCLLLRGITAVTAELHVRYHKPLRVGDTARVNGVLLRARPPVFALSAQLVQRGEVSASATAKFMRAEV